MAKARQKFGIGNTDDMGDEELKTDDTTTVRPANTGEGNDVAEADPEDGEINVLTARARREIQAATVATGKARLKLLKKTHATEWLASALASSTMPPVYRMGARNTFNYTDSNHPWAKIHSSHEAWFCDRIAFCRQCGCSAAKKSTLYKKCLGAPERTQGQPEPHRAKVIRRMTKGLVPPGHNNKWPNARNSIRVEPQPLVVTVDNKVVYARGYEEPDAQALWRQRDVREAREKDVEAAEKKRREVFDRLGIRRRINHYLPEENDGSSSGWIIATAAETVEADADDDAFDEEEIASIPAATDGGTLPSLPPLRRNDISTVPSQPVGKKRRILAFSTDVEVAENRRRKRAGKDFLQNAQTGSSSSSSSSGIRSSLMPPAHPTVIDDAMASESTIEDTVPSSGAGDGNCVNLHINDQPTLTQMMEECMEDAEEDEDVDLI